jgi:hypothetical protein
VVINNVACSGSVFGYASLTLHSQQLGSGNLFNVDLIFFEGNINDFQMFTKLLQRIIVEYDYGKAITAVGLICVLQMVRVQCK